MEEFFENLLGKVVVASIEKEPLSTELLTPEALKKYPNKLYKFRSLHDDKKRKQAFQMIEEEYLWADHPSTFADPNDSRIKLSGDEMKHFRRWLEKHYAEFVFYEMPPKGVMEGEKCGVTLQKIIQHQEDYVGKNGKLKLAELNKVLKQVEVSESMKKLILDKFKRIIQSDFLQEIGTRLFAEYEKLVGSFRRTSLVSCVTKTYCNNMLWENYADNYSGLVIEYSIPPYEQLDDEVKGMLLHLFPVTYSNRIPKVSMIPFFEDFLQKEYYKQDVDYSCSATEIYKQLFYKDSSYAGEREWRFVDCVNTNKIPFPFVSRVIAGHKTKQTVLKKLKKTCDKKGIELLVQKNDDLKCELQYVKYTESQYPRI